MMQRKKTISIIMCIILILNMSSLAYAAEIPTVQSITTDKKTYILELIGTGVIFTVTANYSDGTTKDVTGDCTYISSESTIADVDTLSKMIKSKNKTGTVEFSITYKGKTTKCNVTVRDYFIKIEPATVVIKELNKKYGELTIKQYFSTDVNKPAITVAGLQIPSQISFSSSNPEVAFVQNGNLFSGMKRGKAAIVASVDPLGTGDSNQIRTATCYVTVTNGDVTSNIPKVYSDVNENHWAHKAITEMTNIGILEGFDDGTFKPEQTVTKEQFTKLLALTLDKPLNNSNIPTFQDVTTDNWAYKYIEAVKQYMLSYKIGKYQYFNGAQGAKREEIAAAIVLAKGYDKEIADQNVFNSFNDENQISPYLKNLVAIAIKHNIMQGDNGNIRPCDTLTRAEVCELMNRIKDN